MPSSARCRSPINHRASGSEKRSWMYPRLPRAGGFPKGRAFPSLTAARDSQPSPAGGRRSAPAQTDPPKRLFLFHRARRILFLGKTKRGPRRAPRGGERRSKGAGAVFAAGGNGAERTLRRRQWGAHPRGNGPWREPGPRGRRPVARISPAPFGGKGKHLTSRSRPPASTPRCTAHSGTAGSNPAHTPPRTHPAPQTPPGRR